MRLNSAAPLSAVAPDESEGDSTGPRAGWTLYDILFAIFKYKWLGLVTLTLGLIAAGTTYYFYPTAYCSRAKLLVRYVLDRSTVDSVESQATPVGRSNAGVINSELEILTSWDLALQVADEVGLERMLDRPATAADRGYAAYRVQQGLQATAAKGSNVIWLSYSDPDPARAVLVLERLVDLYFDKHLEVHRSIGAFEFVSEQSDKVRKQLDQTEADLKQLKNKADIISLADAGPALHAALSHHQEELDSAEVELAAQRARIQEMEAVARPATNATGATADQSTLVRFNAIVGRIEALQREQLELLAHFTPENRLVKSNQKQLDDLESQRRALVAQFPTIANAAVAITKSATAATDLRGEKAKLAALEARTTALREQLTQIRARATQFADLAPQITELERRKQVEETNYRYFQSSLERARVDEALDPTQIPNISVVQKPSPASPDFTRRNKILAGIAGGGAALGLALMGLAGLVLDRTLKRPTDIEVKAGLNYLISIPLLSSGRPMRFLPHARSQHPSQRRSQAALGRGSANTNQRHWESLRDRLILGFELAGKTHTPKVVALTSCGAGAGTSSVSVGLAEALSRTGRGKVLLVDMNSAYTDEQGRISGYQATPIADVLERDRQVSPAAENLYLATAQSPHAGPGRPLATRLHDLVPQFKASDFDYVLLDLPSVAESSAALTVAGFVDKVVLVAEGERTTPDTLRRTHAELVAARADVAIVFNKERKIVPRWLLAA